MLDPVKISLAALGLGLLNFGYTFWKDRRESPKIKTKCVLWEADDHVSYPRIHVSVVNAGRRPIIIRLFGGYYGESEFVGGEYIDDAKGGRRLGENEFFERTLTFGEDMIVLFSGEELDERVQELLIEDTLGKRYKIKNSRKILREFWGEQKKVAKERRKN
jgi:hypothetical protein